MDDRFNTIAGWVLFAGIVALGSSIVASEYFHTERPEKMGYPIAGVQEEGEGAAAAEEPIEVYLAKADAAHGQQVFNKCMACHNADKGGAEPDSARICGACSGNRSDRARGFAFSDALAKKGGDVELGQSQPVADQPEGVRARHQNDLRGAQQSAGPRRRRGVPQQPQRFAAAAAQSAAAGRERKHGPGEPRQSARQRAQQRSAKSRQGAGGEHRRGREDPKNVGGPAAPVGPTGKPQR